MEDDRQARVGPVVLRAENDGVRADEHVRAERQPATAVEERAAVQVEVPPAPDAVGVGHARARVNEAETVEVREQGAIEEIAEREPGEPGDRAEDGADPVLQDQGCELPRGERAREAADLHPHGREDRNGRCGHREAGTFSRVGRPRQAGRARASISPSGSGHSRARSACGRTRPTARATPPRRGLNCASWANA